MRSCGSVFLTLYSLFALNSLYAKADEADLDFEVPMTDAFKEKIINDHNEVRRIPYASNMNEMIWDDELAASAAEYSRQCSFDHGPLNDMGENIYVANIFPIELVNSATKLWYAEYKFYNHTSLECEVNKICGHYTQVVWAKTSKVGCAAAGCLSVTGFHIEGSNTIMVCRYHTPGNVYLSDNGNVTPLPPFLDGEPCSECEDGRTRCNDGLCAVGDEETTSSAATTEVSRESTTEAEITSTEPETTRGVTTATVTPTDAETIASTTADPETIGVSTLEAEQTTVEHSTAYEYETTVGTTVTPAVTPTDAETIASTTADAETIGVSTPGTEQTTVEQPTANETTVETTVTPADTTTSPVEPSCRVQWLEKMRKYRVEADKWRADFSAYQQSLGVCL